MQILFFLSRQLTFKAMIHQDMAWFDDSKNSVGALCARLSGDCAGVQGAIGVRLSNLFQAAATIIIGVSLAFYFSWKLTLVSIVAIPVVIFTVYFESQFMEVSNVREKEATENATKLAVEAISNIRTVASLGQEVHVVQRYTEEIGHVETACRKKIRLRGVVFAMGQAMPLMGYALALWYGGTLVAAEEIGYEDVIK
jgi:ATP-binding cassette, subfamily B (MDR/TAP), member 1